MASEESSTAASAYATTSRDAATNAADNTSANSKSTCWTGAIKLITLMN
jgi:hypothetical protein